MPEFSLSAQAGRDLIDISRYTFETFGLSQARIYRQELYETFTSIANHPLMGAPCDHIRPGFRRLTHGSHTVYYRGLRGSIRIMRVLHQSQDPLKHL
ncbi:type II toxin-antitoxin system RelE/ParE family toxin [Asticcacaulis sp. YBE204]|uniref:type II toxin-antitoxin system RelE/ParE family toxin n=1 Tax=Asticcacaulis sp. YBE204 TaxID=1282363 RepID=UPI0003C40310|nr:type II toxin-antitoxin system RelE/ParE family toxin [Asticcacaulis sp. YBE204]ESQ79893.1 hypothetical protein AEYBE204_08585 [Asticcacaulis sp. YBE204]